MLVCRTLILKNYGTEEAAWSCKTCRFSQLCFGCQFWDVLGSLVSGFWVLSIFPLEALGFHLPQCPGLLRVCPLWGQQTDLEWGSAFTHWCLCLMLWAEGPQ